MAKKNIIIKKRNGSEWDEYYPVTTASNIILSGGDNLDACLNLSTYKLGKDENEIYTDIQLKRRNGTLAIRSVLSGGTSPNYTNRTITEYALNGSTVVKTTTYALTYDTDGNLISEVLK